MLWDTIVLWNYLLQIGGQDHIYNEIEKEIAFHLSEFLGHQMIFAVARVPCARVNEQIERSDERKRGIKHQFAWHSSWQSVNRLRQVGSNAHRPYGYAVASHGSSLGVAHEAAEEEGKSDLTEAPKCKDFDKHHNMRVLK